MRVMFRNSGIQVAPVKQNPQKFCICLPGNSPSAVVLSPGLLEFESFADEAPCWIFYALTLS